MLNKTWIRPAGGPNNNFAAFRRDRTFPRRAENRNHESCGKQTAFDSKRWKIACEARNHIERTFQIRAKIPGRAIVGRRAA